MGDTNTTTSPTPVRRTPAVWLATGLGVGLVFPAPGTFGTLLGVPLAWGLSYLPLWLACAAIAVAVLASIPICTTAARDLGGKKDPGAIVLDEIVSLPIVFLLIPFDRWSVVIAGFLLHRVFDISKPPPARQLERLPAGLGIVADDLAAAVYACLVLHLVLWMGWI